MINNKNRVKPHQEWLGIHYTGQEEIDEVNRALKAKSLFRYYGADPQIVVHHLEITKVMRGIKNKLIEILSKYDGLLS